MYKIKFPKTILLVLLVYCKVDMENYNTQTTDHISSIDNNESFTIYSPLVINDFQNNEKYGENSNQEIELEVSSNSAEKNTLKPNQKIYELCKLIFRNTSKYKNIWPFLTHKKIRVDNWCRYTFCGGSHKAIFYKDNLEEIDYIEYDEKFNDFMNIDKIIDEYNFEENVAERIFYDLYILYKRILYNYKKLYETPVKNILNSCLEKDKNLDYLSQTILEFSGIDDLTLIKENLQFKPVLEKIILGYIFLGVKEYINIQFEKSLLYNIFESDYINITNTLTRKIINKRNKFTDLEKIYLGIFDNHNSKCCRNKIGAESGYIVERAKMNFDLRNKSRCLLCSCMPIDAMCGLNLLSFSLKSILLISILVLKLSKSDTVFTPLCLSTSILFIYYLYGLFWFFEFKYFRKLSKTNSTLNFEQMKEEIVSVILNTHEKNFPKYYLCFKKCKFLSGKICQCINYFLQTFCKCKLLKNARACICNGISYFCVSTENLCCKLLSFIFAEPKN